MRTTDPAGKQWVDTFGAQVAQGVIVGAEYGGLRQQQKQRYGECRLHPINSVLRGNAG